MEKVDAPESGPQTDVIESEWKFEESPLTIGDMIEMKIPLKEVFAIEGLSLPIRWINLIQIVNRKLVGENKINTKTSVKKGIEAYTACMSKVFF